ncbi:MAG TPA: hypothetical protein VNG53_02310 [Bacteroidia bacterium]|nr:hypothetical protein [Bacteroidia bacterium]
MKKIFIALLCSAGILSNTSVYGQITFVKGYIIDLKGDTSKGEIRQNEKKEVDNYSKVYFRVSEQAEGKTYRAVRLKEYGFGGQTFIQKKVEGEFDFVRVLATGELNLYEVKYEMEQVGKVVLDSDFYVEKSTDSKENLIHIKSGKFKKEMSELTAKDTNLAQDLEQKKYDYSAIQDVVDAYNQWAKKQ